MKRVLIITYYWPPAGGGGVQRWVKFVKYLREFGWTPVVYTPENPEIQVRDESLLKEVPEDIEVIRTPIREPYTLYKTLTGKKENIQTAFLTENKSGNSWMERLSVWIRGNLFIPDARKYWIKPSVNFLSAYLLQNPVDVIVSTGPPHSMHLIAKKLNHKYKLPWLADFRDPWTNIDYYGELMLGKRADRIHHRLEKQVLKQATEVSVVSPGMRKDFSSIVSRTYQVIPNGYDASDMLGLKELLPERGKFIIAHIGSLTPTRNPENLWRVLGELCKENERFREALEIQIIGKMDYRVAESLREAALDDRVQSKPYMPHSEVVKVQRLAHVLLLAVNNTPNAKLILTGKLFEYLAARRPIICIGPEDGDAAGVISETNSGRTFDLNSYDSLKDHILDLYEGFVKEKDQTTKGNIEGYERRNLTRRMAQVLNSCIA
ncbi:MAG: glycosyltransferase family 4 protein [bacterium]